MLTLCFNSRIFTSTSEKLCRICSPCCWLKSFVVSDCLNSTNCRHQQTLVILLGDVLSGLYSSHLHFLLLSRVSVFNLLTSETFLFLALKHSLVASLALYLLSRCKMKHPVIFDVFAWNWVFKIFQFRSSCIHSATANHSDQWPMTQSEPVSLTVYMAKPKHHSQ